MDRIALGFSPFGLKIVLLLQLNRLLIIKNI
jgi:hypothetical protein